MMKDWLKSAFHASGRKQAEISKYLTKAVGRSVDAAAIGKLLRGERKLYADELIELSRICHYPLPENANGEIDPISRAAAAFDYMERMHDSDWGTAIPRSFHSAMLLINNQAGSRPTDIETLRRQLIILLLKEGVTSSPEEIWEGIDALLFDLKITKAKSNFPTLMRQLERVPSDDIPKT